MHLLVRTPTPTVRDFRHVKYVSGLQRTVHSLSRVQGRAGRAHGYGFFKLFLGMEKVPIQL